MKLRLVYILAAVLIASVAATVYVQVQIAARHRERQAVEAAIAPVLAKLCLGPEVLEHDRVTAERLAAARREFRGRRNAGDPSRWEPMPQPGRVCKSSATCTRNLRPVR